MKKIINEGIQQVNGKKCKYLNMIGGFKTKRLKQPSKLTMAKNRKGFTII